MLGMIIAKRSSTVPSCCPSDMIPLKHVQRGKAPLIQTLLLFLFLLVRWFLIYFGPTGRCFCRNTTLRFHRSKHKRNTVWSVNLLASSFYSDNNWIEKKVFFVLKIHMMMVWQLGFSIKPRKDHVFIVNELLLSTNYIYSWRPNLCVLLPSFYSCFIAYTLVYRGWIYQTTKWVRFNVL